MVNNYKTHRRIIKQSAVPYLLLAPVLLAIGCFMLWPIINVFKMSTEAYKATQISDRHFVGLANYTQIFTQDALFFKTLGNTAVWVFASVAFQTVLGFWLAYLLTKKFRGRGLVRALSLAPWAVAGLMVGIIWALIMGESYGLLNDILKRIGLISSNISWFSNGQLSMFACVLANIWRGIPFFTISYMSSLAGIPDELYESAKIDGANAVATLFQITLPMMKDTIVLTTLLRAIWTFNAVDLIISLTAGGPNYSTTTLALYIMNKFTGEFDYGYASALAVIATLMMMLIALIYIKLSKIGKDGVLG
jgi:multiple sugar transport system permease protein